MTVRKGHALILLGSVVTSGGLFGTFLNLAEMQLVLVWGMVALAGVFTIGIGAVTVSADADHGTAVNPEGALTKTDSRFGRR